MASLEIALSKRCDSPGLREGFITWPWTPSEADASTPNWRRTKGCSTKPGGQRKGGLQRLGNQKPTDIRHGPRYLDIFGSNMGFCEPMPRLVHGVWGQSGLRIEGRYALPKRPKCSVCNPFGIVNTCTPPSNI